jgi:hypothetical protein
MWDRIPNEKRPELEMAFIIFCSPWLLPRIKGRNCVDEAAERGQEIKKKERMVLIH